MYVLSSFMTVGSFEGHPDRFVDAIPTKYTRKVYTYIKPIHCKLFILEFFSLNI